MSESGEVLEAQGNSFSKVTDELELGLMNGMSIWTTLPAKGIICVSLSGSFLCWVLVL